MNELCIMLRRTSDKPAFSLECGYIMRWFLERMYLGKGRVIGVVGARGHSVEALIHRLCARPSKIEGIYMK